MVDANISESGQIVELRAALVNNDMNDYLR